MVNIVSEDLVLVLYIPTNGVALAPGSELGLLVQSTHDKGRQLAWTIQGWEVVGTFFKVCAERPQGLHQGEWQYQLTDQEGVVVSTGLMQVGEMPADVAVVQYNKDVEYKEYGN